MPLFDVKIDQPRRRDLGSVGTGATDAVGASGETGDGQLSANALRRDTELLGHLSDRQSLLDVERLQSLLVDSWIRRKKTGVGEPSRGSGVRDIEATGHAGDSRTGGRKGLLKAFCGHGTSSFCGSPFDARALDGIGHPGAADAKEFCHLTLCALFGDVEGAHGCFIWVGTAMPPRNGPGTAAPRACCHTLSLLDDRGPRRTAALGDDLGDVALCAVSGLVRTLLCTGCMATDLDGATLAQILADEFCSGCPDHNRVEARLDVGDADCDEVMWRIGDRGRNSLVRDSSHAGDTLVSVAVLS